MVLQECPLGTRSNIQDCVTAAQTVQKALNQELSPHLSILQAVTDQKEFFSKLSSAFGKRLQEYLTAQFVNNVSVRRYQKEVIFFLFRSQASLMTDAAQVRHTSGPSMTNHSRVHNELLVYQELTKWLKECQPAIFSELMEVSVATQTRWE